MNLSKKLPIAFDSFDAIIDSSRVYVDKTDLIAEIAQESGPYCFFRPRRFGKTTLVSTFHELFANGLERFKGLKIEQDGLYSDTKTYKVLHLDFSACTAAVDVHDYLNFVLTKEFKRSGIDFDYQGDPCYWLASVLSREANASVVLLIDEYDAPLTHVLNNPAEFEKRREIFATFYLFLKQSSKHLRFLFITGVSRYSNVSIFSGFNNLTDLSLDSRFGALVGYTQEELECYFGDYIERAVCELNRVNNTDQYTRKSVLQLLKQHYNGYCFDELASTLVYNPWSVLKFFEAPQRGFRNYWVETGGAMPSILVKYLDKKGGDDFEFEFERYLVPDPTISVSQTELVSKVVAQDSSEFSFLSVLYHAGYLTIKDGLGDGLVLGVPNLEVKQAFMLNIRDCFRKHLPATFAKGFNNSLQEALKQQNFETVKLLLNKLVNYLTYTTVSQFNESSFRDLFNLGLFFAGVSYSQTEVQNAVGRCDLIFDFNKIRFVCEFKLASNLSEVDSKLAEAEDQIVTKDYANLLGAKKVVPLAIVAVNQNNAQGVEAVRRFEVIKPLKLAGD